MAESTRSRGTLDPKIPSRELRQALDAASARLKDLGKQALTPEALLLTFIAHDGSNAP